MSLRTFLQGPPAALPGWLDRLHLTWVRLPPRVRVAVWGMLLVAAAAQCGAHRTSVAGAWGGEPVLVWQATTTLPAGVDPTGSLRPVELPPLALPANPVQDLPAAPVLQLPLVEGGVLGRAHLDPGGASAAVSADERLVGVPVDAGLGITAGSAVDVWAAGPGSPARLLVAGRPVLGVVGEGGRLVASVSLPEAAVAEALQLRSAGLLLLTVAPG